MRTPYPRVAVVQEELLAWNSEMLQTLKQQVRQRASMRRGFENRKTNLGCVCTTSSEQFCFLMLLKWPTIRQHTPRKNKQSKEDSFLQVQSICGSEITGTAEWSPWEFRDLNNKDTPGSICCCSLLFSCSVVSDSLKPHGLQHTRLPCPSLSPGICSNSCPLNQRCHPTISSSIAPFSSYL